MKNTTALVISFLRPDYTTACIKSLREMYPEIQIVVGENADFNEDLKKVCDTVGAKYVQLPYDSGICVARNTLIKAVETEYVLVGDDDFLYDKDALVDQMVAFLEGNKDFDVIGGRIRQDGIVKDYQGLIEKRINHFQTYPINADEVTNVDPNSGLRYCKADLTFNYFVGRTEKIREVPWDEEIKVAYEHFSWFYDFKVAGGRVAFSPNPIVIHKPAHIANMVNEKPEHATYLAYRNRKSDKDRFFAKYNLSYTIGMNGVKSYAPDHIMEVRKNDIKYVDFCITTFKRPKALERLLHSIAEFYPMANVYVADQNDVFDRAFYKKLRNDLYDIGLQKRPSIERLPYDCGLSHARNHLVRTTPNRYKLILDDDMVFTKDTDISKMVKLLELHPSAGIVGGMVVQGNTELHFEFNLEKVGDEIIQVPDKNAYKKIPESNTRYRKTGCVLNFALMRREVFGYIEWDNALKVSEHIDFYMRMRKVPYQILYTPDVWIEHEPMTERDEDYKDLRKRTQFQVYMMRKHQATKIRYLNGQVTELLPDGSLKRYKEKPNA